MQASGVVGQQNTEPDERGIEMAEEDDIKQNLRGITDELTDLRHRLVQQLSQEIEQLQERKTRLLADTELLERQREEQLTQQQVMSQQLAQQLAPAIAEQLLAYLQKQAGHQQDELGQYNENAYQLISSLDTTLRNTFNTLEQDVSSYQSTLSQQIRQMYSQEQQAQIILDTLVSRIREELQAQGTVVPTPVPIQPPQTFDQGVPVTSERSLELPPVQPEPQPLAPTVRPSQPNKRVVRRVTSAQIRIGFLLVLASSLLLSLQNVVISILLRVLPVFGFLTDALGMEQINYGGIVAPGFGNSLLVLFLRMLVVVPLMMVLSKFLYPPSGQEIQQFVRSGDRRAFRDVILCGFFLFTSSVFIYLALSALNPGIALTLFFVFPIVTVVCAWLFFGDRPSPMRWTATFIVFLGIVLIMTPTDGATLDLPAWGIFWALMAGITFAFHVLLIQSCTKRLHPVPFSVLNFSVMLGLCTVSILPLLLLDLPPRFDINVDMANVLELGIFGFILGGLTLLSYLTNNIGISYIGAARASIVGATGPALTSLLAWLLTSQDLTGLKLWGMFIVTVGVLAQNLERLIKKTPIRKKA